MIQEVKPTLVTALDPEIRVAQNKTFEYLLSLDPKRFLVEFNRVAGLPNEGRVGYGGWERATGPNFRGHFVGHYLSALAQSLVSCRDEVQKKQLHQRLRTLVDGLARVQAHYGEQHPVSAGYVSAFREVALDRVEGKVVLPSQKENVIVPWYNLHKILAGLLAVHQFASGIDPELSAQALNVAVKFGDYVYRRVTNLDDNTKMLQTEYGGMNDALYDLFEVTHDGHHLIAATYFDEVSLFEQLAQNRDVLAGKHANTTIPKLIGALKRYTIFQNESLAKQFLTLSQRQELSDYRRAAENFWQMVIQSHTYITGGNSQSEHFHEPNQLYHDAVLAEGATTCETCNTYNMLKLSRNLYRLTGDKQYLDYYERTYVNAILGSQNRKTGMMTYFQAMGAGYHKVFNRPTDEFWCCTGTGIESFTKLSDSDYFWDQGTLVVNLYFSNELVLQEHNLKITQLVDRPTGAVSVNLASLSGEQETKSLNIDFRRPDWVQGAIQVEVNGQARQTYDDTQSFIRVDALNAGGSVKFVFPLKLSYQTASDNLRYLAFQYGPYVLAGIVGNQRLNHDCPDGVLVRISDQDEQAPKTLTAEVTLEKWLAKLPEVTVSLNSESNYLATMTLPDIEEDITFVPYYQLTDLRYGIYFQYLQSGSPESIADHDALMQYRRHQKHAIAELTEFDNNNFELARQLNEHLSTVGVLNGRRYRQASAEGYFRYRFKLPQPSLNLRLELTFNRVDVGKKLYLKIGETATETRAIKLEDYHDDEKGFFKMVLDFSPSAFDNKTGLELTFSAKHATGPKIFGIALITVSA